MFLFFFFFLLATVMCSVSLTVVNLTICKMVTLLYDVQLDVKQKREKKKHQT